MLCGESCHDFAIYQDVLLLELTGELAPSLSFWAQGGIDTHEPELTEIVLLVLAVGKGVAASMHEGFIRCALLCRAAMAKAFYRTEYITAGFESINCFFYSSHRFTLNTGKETTLLAVNHTKTFCLPHASMRRGALTCVEVVLAWGSSGNLAVFRDLEALAERLVRFHIQEVSPYRFSAVLQGPF